MGSNRSADDAARECSEMADEIAKRAKII